VTGAVAGGAAADEAVETAQGTNKGNAPEKRGQ
jgi:hypothetical protein